MSEWQAKTLGEVCELKRGYDLPAASRLPGAVPIVSSSGVTGFHAAAKVRGPGVVTGRYGTLGEVFYVEEDFWPLNTALYVRDFKGNDPRFVAALLEALELGKNDGAAAVPGVNRNQLHLLPVVCPDSYTQRRIGMILRIFDDLIQNCGRRVELLEQMAQAIYREWFVRFSYPGNTGAVLVDSPLGPIPDGWELRPFADIASFINGFAFKPEHWGAAGRPIIKIRELKQGVTPNTPRCDTGELAPKYWVEPGDLLFSWSADLGAYRWSYEPGLLNQHLFTVIPRPGLSLAFLFRTLNNAMPHFRDRAQGTTMRHIKRAALSEVSAIVPPQRLVDLFTDAVEPIDQHVISLRAASERLAATRDLLLPKLVTGQLDVSNLHLDQLLDSVA